MSKECVEKVCSILKECKGVCSILEELNNSQRKKILELEKAEETNVLLAAPNLASKARIIRKNRSHIH